MASTWVQVLSSPAVSAGIGALAGLGGGWIAARSQQKERQTSERERRREVAAQAVGPVLSLVLGGQLERAGPGPGDLSSRLGAWEAAWSTSREHLLIMTAGHSSGRVHRLGLEVADLVPEWLQAVRQYLIAAQELSQARRNETLQRVLEETQDPSEARTEADQAADIRLDGESALTPARSEVESKWGETMGRVRELLNAVREET